MARILVIDEDKESLNFVRFCLSNKNHKIITEKDPFDALELIHLYKFDLIITEINFSKTNGLRLLTSLKRSKKNKDTKIVLFSNQNEDKDIRRAIQIGLSGYIIKPVTMRDFTYRLEQILNDLSPQKEQYFFLPQSDYLSKGQALVMQDIEIKRVSELSVTFISRFKIGDLDSTIQLKSPFFSLMGFEVVRGKISSIVQEAPFRWMIEIHYLRPRDVFVKKVKEKIYASIV